MDGISFIQTTIDSESKIHLVWEPHELPLKVLEIFFNFTMEDFTQVVRIHEMTPTFFQNQNDLHFFELPISYYKGEWSIKGLAPNKRYNVEIGVKIFENHFFPLLRSNPICIPNNLTNNKESIDLFLVQQIHEMTPKWMNQVSTYSYYGPTLGEKNE
ncbi:MAG: DUF4912 domain-containing protein [Bacillota bacterium]|nr:DUF4912 domain-containing protein [Bacillota bacterium]